MNYLNDHNNSYNLTIKHQIKKKKKSHQIKIKVSVADLAFFPPVS